MRVQDSAFRLPALKLQPREYKFNLSQESIDQNLSKEAIKNQSPLNHYNPSPIRNRNKMMSVSVYNSQEKIKQSNETKYLQNSDFITCQNTNNSISVVQTVRRYRSKLKKMVQHNYNKSEINSRDPRYFFFKEPSATIRLANLQENSKQVDKILEERIKLLMTKVQMLLSTQSFYQVQKSQDRIKVNLVKLQDEYNLLYQDFNEFYFSTKNIDAQIKNLLNHMQIIKQLLSPLSKPFHKYAKSSQSLHQNVFDLIQEDPKESITQRVISNAQNAIDFQEKGEFDQQLIEQNEELEQINEIQENQQGRKQKPGRQLTGGQKVKKSGSKGIYTKQGTINSQLNEQENDYEEDSDLSENDQKSSSNSPNKKRKSGQIGENKNNEQIIDQNQDGTMDEPAEIQKTKKLQGGISSKRRQAISTIDGDGFQNPGIHYDEDGNIIIKEEEYSQDELESEERTNSQKKQRNNQDQDLIWKQNNQNNQQIQDQLIETQQDIVGEEGIIPFQSHLIIQHPNHELNCYQLLDRFISLENIYDYRFLQSWDYHIQKIKQAKFFDEFDI